jgi:hypothetical protein
MSGVTQLYERSAFPIFQNLWLIRVRASMPQRRLAEGVIRSYPARWLLPMLHSACRATTPPPGVSRQPTRCGLTAYRRGLHGAHVSHHSTLRAEI